MKTARGKDKKSSAKIGPLVVHCSAGIGRTGTFCTVHSSLWELRKQIRRNHGKIPARLPPMQVYWKVKKFRLARSGMVQQPEQYAFAYNAIMKGAEDMGYTLPKMILNKEDELLRDERRAARDAVTSPEPQNTKPSGKRGKNKMKKDKPKKEVKPVVSSDESSTESSAESNELSGASERSQSAEDSPRQDSGKSSSSEEHSSKNPSQHEDTDTDTEGEDSAFQSVESSGESSEETSSE